MLAIRMDHVDYGDVRATLIRLDSDGNIRRTVNIATASFVNLAVQNVIEGFDETEIGILMDDGSVEIPDCCSLEEAAEAALESL